MGENLTFKQWTILQILPGGELLTEWSYWSWKKAILHLFHLYQLESIIFEIFKNLITIVGLSLCCCFLKRPPLRHEAHNPNPLSMSGHLVYYRTLFNNWVIGKIPICVFFTINWASNTDKWKVGCGQIPLSLTKFNRGKWLMDSLNPTRNWLSNSNHQ